MSALPTLVIGGWLGSGKTTLVNHLLRHAGGRRIAVLVNDFGSSSVDADLIESEDGALRTLAGGCICCAIGSELVEALWQLPAQWPGIEQVVIETSGLAQPDAVARAAGLVTSVTISGKVVLACAATVRARAEDPFVGDLVRAQLAAADLIVINQVDRVAPEALAATRDWLNVLAPGCPQMEAVRGELPPDLLLGSWDASPKVAGLGTRLPAADHRFAALSVPAPGRYQLHALVQTLSDPALGLLRVKGVLRDAQGRWTVLQGVGTRIECSPPRPGSAAGRGKSEACLTAIGPAGAVDEAGLCARLAAACCLD